MKFEESEFSKLKHFKLEMRFGNFYFLETFFISELNEGVHFNWEMIKRVMDKVVDFYGKDIKLGYISNRVNSYSMSPQAWGKVDRNYGIIIASAIIYYNDFSYKNASLEKLFSKKSIKRCINLDEAIYWMENLKEFN